MSDPATRLHRLQRQLRRHLRRHPHSPLMVLRRPLLDTRARYERSLCGNALCPCADIGPACPEWMGIDGETGGRCPRCGAERRYHDHDEPGTTS